MNSTVTKLNPVSYFVEVIQMVILKGSGFSDSLAQVSKTALYAYIMNSLAVWSYKKIN